MTLDTNSTISSTCSAFEDDFSRLCYTEDYDGTGSAALMIYYSSIGWQTWITDGTASQGGAVDSVTYNNGQFSYLLGI